MDLGPLRTLVIDLNWEVLGVDVTVTPPGGDPVDTRGIWVTPQTELVPAGFDFPRVERRRVLALKRADVATVPRQSVILAREVDGESPRSWKVDGVDRIEAEHVRVV